MHVHDILAWHWGMWIFMIIFWFLIIVAIIVIIKWFYYKTRQKESAIEILERRYARGEISKEDFNKMKEIITEMRS